MRPYGDARTLEQRRLRAIRLSGDGFGPGEIAAQLGVDRRSVHRWLAAYRDHGVEALAPLPVPGRPCKLSARDRDTLTGMLLEGAMAFGYPTDLWTSPRVADLIRRRLRVTYHAHHVSRLLRSLGFSPQKPERRARERDEAAIRGWVRTQWPRVKKNASRLRASLVFLDESGLLMAPLVRRWGRHPCSISARALASASR